MVYHSTTLIRTYFGAQTFYLVPLELDLVDHTTTTDVVKSKVAKVDLTTSLQTVLLYQHIWHYF